MFFGLISEMNIYFANQSLDIFCFDTFFVNFFKLIMLKDLSNFVDFNV